ncbi:MAG: hypothetical protein ACYDG4_13420 [Desulfuromonadaceae bacterium]
MMESCTIDTQGNEIRSISDLKKGEIFLDSHGVEWAIDEQKRSLVHVKRVSDGKPGHFVKNIDVKVPIKVKPVALVFYRENI